MPELRKIAPDDDGIRLDRWFKRHYPALTHARLEKLLRKGEVRLEGKRAKAADRLSTGQTLRLPPQVIHDKTEARPKAAPVHTARKLEDMILYMDKHLFVLNKPPGLATQGGSGLKEHVDGMLDQITFEKNTRPKLVHRLDRDTSGVLLVARTAQSAAGLSRALAERDASKIYWALVKGVPQEKHGIIKGALAKEGVRGQGERMEISESEEAKFALTEYAVMGQAGQEFSWIAAKPVTGRTHQIRVHLASLGTPIVGDFKYGGAESRGKGAIADKLHLHARSLDIARPDGGRLQVTAPLPPHMLKSWELLGFDPNDPRDAFCPAQAQMKRFYKDAAIEQTGGEFRILLDGKPVRTPGGKFLAVPGRALAQTIAAEWRGQKEEIDPASMPMLRMANTVLDGIAANRPAVVDAILRFGEHDLICYRAEQPLELAALQDQSWSPMLAWLAARHDARLTAGAGLAHIPQSPEALAGLRRVLEGMDDFALAALHVMASVTGSLVLALALAEGEINPAQAFQMSRIDEDYQAGKWGADAEAEMRARALARELDVASGFLAASRG